MLKLDTKYLTTHLIDKGMTPDQAELAVKALPSAPVWIQGTIDYGFWDANRERLLQLMAFYQKNDCVHGCIDTIAKSITDAGCKLMEVTEVAKKKLPAGRRRVRGKRWRRLRKQWSIPQLARKSLDDDQALAEVESHPMLDAMNSTDNDQTMQSLLRLIVVNLCVFGIAFCRKVREGGSVAGYQYLPAYNVTPDRGTDGKLQGWFYSSTYGEAIPKKIPIDKQDMLVVRWPSLTDPHAGGDGPLLSALAQLELFDTALSWQEWTFANRGRMDGVFIPKIADGGSLSPDEANRSEKRINDKLRGPGNGRWVVAEQAGQYVPISWAPTDLAALEIEDKLRKAVMFALQVPEAFSNNDGNRANLEGSLEQFARFCVAPIVSLLETALNAEMTTEFEGAGSTELLWVFENVVPEDEQFQLEEAKAETERWQVAMQYGGIDNDEYRVHVLGIEPKDESELYEEPPEPPAPPAGDGTLPKDAPAAKPENDEADEADEGTEKAGKSIDLVEVNKMVRAGSLDRATAINLVAFSLGLDGVAAKQLVTHTPKPKRRPALPTLAEPDAGGLAYAVKRQVAQQVHHYLNQCTAAATKSLPDPAAEDLATKDDKGNKDEQQTDRLTDQFVRESEWDAQDQMAYKPYLQLAAEAAAHDRVQAYAQLGADPGVFSVVRPNIQAAVDRASLKFAQSTNQTTEKELNDALDQLRQEIAGGVAEGDPPTLLRQRVQRVFENVDGDRADLIARTETSRAQHAAQAITAKASGMVSHLKWLASSDCCDECQELDGKEVALGEPFKDGEGYDRVPHPPAHPRCRCTMTEVLDLGDDDQEEPTNG